MPSFRVLLADDATDVRALTRKALERTGRFEIVAEASDGAGAVAAAKSHQPDLVLLDLSMPVMDGLTALPLIRAAVPDAVIVVLSGLEAERVAAEVRAQGASAFMPKALTAGRVADQLLAFMDQESAQADRDADLSREASLQLEPEPLSPGQARRFIEQTLGGWACDHLADIVKLLTSELVTNAVLHAGTPATLTLRTDGNVLRISVADSSPLPPVVRQRASEATTGRGMVLLDAMAASWSVVPTDAGKVVWFEVPTAPAGDA